MHIGLEATTLRSELLGGVWRNTESLIAALCRLAAPHQYSLLFLNAFKPWARAPSPRVPPCAAMRLVEVTRVSNFLFTFLLPTVPRRWGGPAVESFLGSVDLFHSVMITGGASRTCGRGSPTSSARWRSTAMASPH